jgi:hypothetical protein
VERKRHLGNDVVLVVFRDGGKIPFSPEHIASQFNHVFCVVQPEGAQYRCDTSRPLSFAASCCGGSLTRGAYRFDCAGWRSRASRASIPTCPISPTPLSSTRTNCFTISSLPNVCYPLCFLLSRTDCLHHTRTHSLTHSDQRGGEGHERTAVFGALSPDKARANAGAHQEVHHLSGSSVTVLVSTKNN